MARAAWGRTPRGSGALADQAVGGACRAPAVGEAAVAQELRAALQLGAQRLRELPHPYRVGGDEVLGDVRQLRTGREALAALAARAVHEEQAEPVGRPPAAREAATERRSSVRPLPAGPSIRRWGPRP
ncbi:hypothetical protein O1L60_14460 [Streptomyces diastatochromogenes]|nr:hypothetical protein [Streptomyces diastatochromogenes]